MRDLGEIWHNLWNPFVASIVNHCMWHTEALLKSRCSPHGRNIFKSSRQMIQGNRLCDLDVHCIDYYPGALFQVKLLLIWPFDLLYSWRSLSELEKFDFVRGDSSSSNVFQAICWIGLSCIKRHGMGNNGIKRVIWTQCNSLSCTSKVWCKWICWISVFCHLGSVWVLCQNVCRHSPRLLPTMVCATKRMNSLHIDSDSTTTKTSLRFQLFKHRRMS